MGVLEREEWIVLQGLRGGIGCDIVTGTGTFTARKGRIYNAVSLEDNSGIEAITEDRNQETASIELTAASGLSYLLTANTAAFGAGVYVIFDYPLRSIKLAKGSFIVYYQNL